MIELAKKEDLKRLKQIANQNREFIGFVMNVALEEAILKESLYVYKQDNLIIGFVHFHRRLDGWNTIHELVIDKLYQKQGVGQKLFNIVPKPIRLKTTKDNFNACLFYEKNGMSIKKTEVGRKRELLVFESPSPKQKMKP